MLVDKAKENLLRDGRVQPVTLFFYPDANIRALKMNTESERTKQADARLIEQIVTTTGPEAVATIIEGWMSVIHSDKRVSKEEIKKIKAEYNKRPPSQRTDRKECIVVQIKTQQGQVMKMTEIVRDGDKITFKDEKETALSYESKFTDRLWKYDA